MQAEFVLLNLGGCVDVQQGTLTVQARGGLNYRTVLAELKQKVPIDMDDTLTLKDRVNEHLQKHPNSSLVFSVMIDRRGSEVATTIKLIR